ncbi:tyrosine-type recombinase/integrase [Thermodesulfobacteriota bacterium]
MGVTIRQKNKGKGKPWWVFVAHNGKRTSRRVGDKKAAEEVASKIQAKLNLGEFGFDEKKKPIPLFKNFAEGFMDTYSAMNHKESTHDSYRTALDLHLIPYFGEKALDAITRKDVKNFINQKQKEGLKSGTVRNLKAYFSAILSEAVDDELIKYNPASMTGKLIKKKDIAKEVNPLTWEEKVKFEDAMKKHFSRYYPFFLTALRTGMRLGELIALQPGDLDFKGRFIEVRRGFTKGRITTPKSGNIRRVDMSNELATILKAHITEGKKEALKKGRGEPPEWLFYKENGRMVDGDNIRKRIFYKCLEKAELRRIRMHDLRHTYATLRIMKGDNIKDVSKQLGHHSIKITLDTYSHWMPGAKKSEVDELDLRAAPDCTLYAPNGEQTLKKDLNNNA